MNTVITLLIILIALYLLGNIAFSLMFDNKARRRPPGDAHEEDDEHSAFPRAWLLHNAEREDLYIQSEDDLKLHAACVRNAGSHKWAIILHGYTSDCEHFSAYAEHYHARGYNVLLPDARAHGLSEGRYIGMGWPERLDLLRWCAYVNGQDPQAEILCHGMSMGAATALLACGESALPRNVYLAVADSAYSSGGEVMKHGMKSFYHLPAFPLLYLADFVCRLKCGFSFIRQGSAEAAVRRSQTPTFFIHGSRDRLVPLYMHEKLYAACAAPKDRLLLDEGHIMGRFKQEALYWQSVDAFIGRYMP